MIYTIALIALALATIVACAIVDYRNGDLSNPFKK
jgi:hypothetical protein